MDARAFGKLVFVIIHHFPQISNIAFLFFSKNSLHFENSCYNISWSWACSAAGSAKGSVFCHIYNFILLYSSVPLLELLIWAYSSAGRAYGSHPYETSSHGSGSLPIQQSDFPDFPLKIEYLKNPFFITFLIEKWPIWARSSAGSARGPVICPLFWAGGSHGSHPVRIPFY